MADEPTTVDPTPLDEGGDGLLTFIVMMTNRLEAEIGFTITTGGLVITGQLVSARVYYEGIATEVEQRATSDTEGGQSIRKAFAERFRQSAAEIKAEDDKFFDPKDGEERGPAPLPACIHLRGARAITPDGEIPLGNWWRGLLREVDGFNFGALTVSLR